MFTTSVRGGKAFAAEQKIRELKCRIAILNSLKMKVTPTKIIATSSGNMNSVLNEKYGLSPNETEKKSLSSEKFRKLFNLHRIERTKKLHDRQVRYVKKKYGAKRKKLRENLDIGEKVLVLAEIIRKKSGAFLLFYEKNKKGLRSKSFKKNNNKTKKKKKRNLQKK